MAGFRGPSHVFHGLQYNIGHSGRRAHPPLAARLEERSPAHRAPCPLRQSGPPRHSHRHGELPGLERTIAGRGPAGYGRRSLLVPGRPGRPSRDRPPPAPDRSTARSPVTERQASTLAPAGRNETRGARRIRLGGTMSDETVDVLIVGSGHSGGMAAKILTEKGISCLLLNAGPVADVHKDTEVKPAYALPFRGFKQPSILPHVFQSNEFNANTWVDEKENPYTYDAARPYNWVRVLLFGGRSLFWSRQSFRMSDYEFKARSHDGYGDDWPIGLADLAPYYSRVEEIFRVSGHADGLLQYPDGNFVPDNSPWSGSMQRMVDAGKGMGIAVCKARSSMGVDGLASSVNLLLPDAIATGRLRAIPNVVVRALSVDKNTGLVNEAHFVVRLSRREMSVKARVVVLVVRTLESTRLLLNSGLANSSGVLGHYLIDQIYGAGIACSVPEARDGKTSPELTGGSALVPRFRNIESKAPNFLRGYALNVFSSTG